MRLTLIAVGRVKGPLATAANEYETRAERYWKLSVIEVGSGARGGDASTVRNTEGERILARVPAGHSLWALTRDGQGIDSVSFAERLRQRALGHAPGLVFAIGGAFGLSKDVMERAELGLSLSPFTLPHDLARVLLLEQLYRAGTLVRGEPYHKG